MGDLLTVRGNVSGLSHVLECRLLELFRLEVGSRLRSELKNARADLFVGVLLVGDHGPINGLILAHGEMNEGKLGVVPKLTHLPVKVVLVVAKEDLLGHFVAVGQLEDLGVEVLLLLWDLQSDLLLLNSILKDVLCVLREVEVRQLLQLNLLLLHIDDLGEVVVVCEGRVVEDIAHFLLN